MKFHTKSILQAKINYQLYLERCNNLMNMNSDNNVKLMKIIF